MLVVLLSWVSFWIDLESVPARISLGILTMLTITTQSSGQGRFPAVSFTKAIDVWMATCLVFVFGSFIEYSIVNVLARREKINANAISKASATGGIAQVINATIRAGDFRQIRPCCIITCGQTDKSITALLALLPSPMQGYV